MTDGNGRQTTKDPEGQLAPGRERGRDREDHDHDHGHDRGRDCGPAHARDPAEGHDDAGGRAHDQDHDEGDRPPLSPSPAAAAPPPAEITFEGKFGKNPLAEAGSFRALCARLPSVLRETATMAWRTDRRAVVLLLVCQVLTGVAAAVLLAFTAEAMRPILGAGPVSDRLHEALPALLVVVAAAGTGRLATLFATYADGRITPPLTTAADLALVEAVCRVEVSAYAEDGFADRQEAAEMGVVRTHLMVKDAQRFLASLIRMVAAGGVLAVLHPLMLPLLALAVLPAGVSAALSARVDYETHYANLGDRNVRSMMRWWTTTARYADEVRANGMTDYLVFWYRSLSARIDRRTLTVPRRTLRIALAGSLVSGLFLIGTWATLLWLAVSGRVELAVAATAVVAVQTTLAALGQLVMQGAAMFHTSLYLADMRGFLDFAAERSTRRGELAVPSRPEEIRLDKVVYRYPNKEAPALDGVSLGLRRGEIVAVVGENGSGKSTLTRLVTGLTVPSQGRVSWDGVDLAAADPHSVWAGTGLVPQDFARWPLRVSENVHLGQPRHGSSGDGEGGGGGPADDDPVWDALDKVGMRTVVEELPHGLDTLLARELWGGVELSGGQWQRLACSRLFHRRPGVLVLDEPTSEMDARGEHAIFNALKTLAADRITLVVTHRIENTRMADRILVMDGGRIVEQGTYEQLVAGGGLFAELHTLSLDR
ncbi:ABC transporter ATP-binding protein [Streptomyces sp. NA04227]|uniref:ATP-binding cassette domain-containing protein n=1 Tax=Streptomyces sp. NA04227 TaxID=2742136 RepID=UPI001590E808|nr:ABC transporter ATP-binding protein [Streptomyces sp. NA04227]QKW10887.1 ABC transporter ATP-binding protein [Streptomyces sp. NA04227]